MNDKQKICTGTVRTNDNNTCTYRTVSCGTFNNNLSTVTYHEYVTIMKYQSLPATARALTFQLKCH